jgi:hypothetical protein
MAWVFLIIWGLIESNIMGKAFGIAVMRSTMLFENIWVQKKVAICE